MVHAFAFENGNGTAFDIPFKVVYKNLRASVLLYVLITTNSRTDNVRTMAATARLALFYVVLVAFLALDECKYL